LNAMGGLGKLTAHIANTHGGDYLSEVFGPIASQCSRYKIVDEDYFQNAVDSLIEDEPARYDYLEFCEYVFDEMLATARASAREYYDFMSSEFVKMLDSNFKFENDVKIFTSKTVSAVYFSVRSVNGFSIAHFASLQELYAVFEKTRENMQEHMKNHLDFAYADLLEFNFSGNLGMYLASQFDRGRGIEKMAVTLLDESKVKDFFYDSSYEFFPPARFKELALDGFRTGFVGGDQSIIRLKAEIVDTHMHNQMDMLYYIFEYLGLGVPSENLVGRFGDNEKILLRAQILETLHRNGKDNVLPNHGFVRVKSVKKLQGSNAYEVITTDDTKLVKLDLKRISALNFVTRYLVDDPAIVDVFARFHRGVDPEFLTNAIPSFSEEYSIYEIENNGHVKGYFHFD